MPAGAKSAASTGSPNPSASPQVIDLVTGCRRCAGSPQVATRKHVEERHDRDKTEQSPGQLRTASDIATGGQVDPYEDHGDGMKETDQELEDLLHYLNLPAALGAAGPRLGRLHSIWALAESS